MVPKTLKNSKYSKNQLLKHPYNHIKRSKPFSLLVFGESSKITRNGMKIKEIKRRKNVSLQPLSLQQFLLFY